MSFWDKIAPAYDLIELVSYFGYKGMRDGIKQIVPEGAKVLDCAAGTGELTVAAAEKARSVMCSDLSEAMLHKSMEKCFRHRFTNVAFQSRNIYELPDKDNTYDIVIAGNVLHLLDDPVKAVNELCRVTKPGGKIIMPTFLSGEKLSGTVITNLYKKFGFDPAHSYDLEEYERMLSSCNISRLKITLIDNIIPVGFALAQPKKSCFK